MNWQHAIWQLLLFIRNDFIFYQKSVAKKEESDDDFDLFASSSDEDKPVDVPTPSKPSKKQVKQVEIVRKISHKIDIISVSIPKYAAQSFFFLKSLISPFMYFDFII